MPRSRPLYSLSRRTPLGLGLALLLAVSACGNPQPFANMGGGRIDEGLRAADAAGRSEAARDLESQVGASDVTLSQSGMQATAFRALDKDGDGRLNITERAATLRQVWDGMTAIASARQNQNPVSTAVTPAEYMVAHPLTYSPAQAEIFIDAGEIMPAVFATLQSATRTIRLDLFLLGGTQGQKLAELLVAKAKEGVDVRILHDPGYGLAGTAHAQIVPVMRFLQANGIAIKSYPLNYLQRRGGHPLANRFQIDHDKLVVVDREVAMVGTMNLIDIGTMNHDVYLRVRGAAAEELANILDATWQLKGASTPLFPEPKPTPSPKPLPSLVPPSGHSLTLLGLTSPNEAEARARVTKTDIDQQTTKKVLLDAFKEARKSIHVAIFEFGDVDIAHALVEANKRGLDVRVLADKNAHYDKYLSAFKGVKLYGTPNLVTTNILRDAGVPVKWYIPQAEDQELHMKLAVVDGERLLAGSTNYTYQAFRTFRETNLDIISTGVAARVELMFERDWATRGTPVTKPDFYEKTIMAAVKAFDKLNLSWW